MMETGTIGTIIFNSVNGSDKLKLPKVVLRQLKASGGLVGSFWAWDTFRSEPFNMTTTSFIAASSAMDMRDEIEAMVGTVQNLDVKTALTVGDAKESFLVKVIGAEFDIRFGINSEDDKFDTVFTVHWNLEATKKQDQGPDNIGTPPTDGNGGVLA